MNLAFLYMFCMFLLYMNSAKAQDVVKKQQQTLSSEASTCNMNTYNNYYAGPSKKVESLLVDIKRQLDEIKKVLSDLTKEEHNATEHYKKNCAELYKSGERISGVYTIKPDQSAPFDVYCDLTTVDGGVAGGWTVFQKRLDGTVDFYRGWEDYKRGFGNLNGEFWLGLDKINLLTRNNRNRLRVELEDIQGNTAYADYDVFSVSSERTKYQLSLGTYHGTAGDSLGYHRGHPFTTKDQDHDGNPGNCAVIFKGAWWYDNCVTSCLNGVYLHGAHSSKYHGVYWEAWKGDKYSAKRAEMKIRPVDF